MQELLGPGEGLCLDLGCGSGHYFGALAATGRTVVGLDYSADQLRVAHLRSRLVVRGDAAALPFGDGTFGAVATMWLSTDVDDFGAVIAEAARVLRPGGVLGCYLAHPCFNGPHIEWLDDGGVRAHPTYRHAGWHRAAVVGFLRPGPGGDAAVPAGRPAQRPGPGRASHRARCGNW